MISVEPRPAATINVVTQSGDTTHPLDTEIQPTDARVCKAPVQIPAFDITRERETFMEAKKDFAGPSTSVTPTQSQQLSSQSQEASRDNVSTLSSFLQSCLKLL